MNIRKFTPGVDKRILVLLAGLMWCGVGIMLVRYAVLWLSSIDVKEQFYFYTSGLLSGILIHHFGFLKIADKNLKRLLPLTEKKCLFSFMPWKSYIIVPVSYTHLRAHE